MLEQIVGDTFAVVVAFRKAVGGF